MIIRYINNQISQFKHSSLIQNAFKIAFGNIIAQILSFVFTPINSRIYGPQYYGEFGVFSSTYILVNGLVTLGLVSAILSPKDDKEASGIYKISAISCTSFSIVFFTIAMVISPWIRIINSSANYYIVVVLLAIALIINNLTSMNYTWGNRQKAYRLLLWNPIIASVVNFVVSLISGIIGFKEYGLILGFIISQIAIFLHLYIRFKPLKYKNSFSDLRSLLKKYSDFPKYQMTSNLIKGIALNLPILLMSSIFGDIFLGQYNMGQRLLFVPITLIATALGQVHFKESTDLVNQGKDAGELTYKVIKLIMTVCFIPFLIIGIWGSDIFRIFLGTEWELSGTLVKIRSLEFMFTAIYFSTSYIFVVIKRQKAVLIYTIISLLGSLLALAIGGYVFNNNVLTVMLISIVNIVLYIIFYLYAFKYTTFGVKPFVKLIAIFSFLFIVLQVIGNLIFGGI